MSQVVQLPLVFDAHNHPSYYALLASCPDLSALESRTQVLEALAQLEPAPLHIVTGFHSGKVHLRPQDLEAFPPLVLINFSLHGFLCNRAGGEFLQSKGIDPYPQSPRQAEEAMTQLLRFFPTYVASQLGAHKLQIQLKKYVDTLQRAGVYGAYDMMYILPQEPGEVFPADFILKPYYAFPLDPQLALPNTKLPLKLFTDGALGAKTAALSSGYLGEATPVLIYEPQQFRKTLAAALERASSLAIHAIGDLAIEQVLDAYAPLAPSFPEVEVRLEHCQFITLEQAQRSKKLGIVLSCQPNFSEDSLYYADRLQTEALERNNPLRMLIDKAHFQPGVDLFWGSDGMPSGLERALQMALFPPYPQQALSLEELLAGYRADPKRGTIALSIDYSKGSVRGLEPDNEA